MIVPDVTVATLPVSAEFMSSVTPLSAIGLSSLNGFDLSRSPPLLMTPEKVPPDNKSVLPLRSRPREPISELTSYVCWPGTTNESEPESSALMLTVALARLETFPTPISPEVILTGPK